VRQVAAETRVGLVQHLGGLKPLRFAHEDLLHVAARPRAAGCGRCNRRSRPEMLHQRALASIAKRDHGQIGVFRIRVKNTAIAPSACCVATECGWARSVFFTRIRKTPICRDRAWRWKPARVDGSISGRLRRLHRPQPAARGPCGPREADPREQSGGFQPTQMLDQSDTSLSGN